MNKTISLDGANIDAISSELEHELINNYKYDSKDAKIICLTTEEILLNIREKNGEQYNVSISFKKHFGKCSILVSFDGEAYDPRMNDNELSDLLTLYELIPDYSFKNGKNTVSIPAIKRKKSALPGILTGLVISILIILLSEVIPGTAFKNVISSIITPAFNTIIGFISAIAGPIIFLSVLSGILAIADIKTLKSAGLRIVRDSVILLTVSASITVFVSMKTYGVHMHNVTNNLSDFSAVIQMLFDIIPVNLISPFVNGNSMQIIFLAILSGIVILALNTKINVVSNFIYELNSIFQQIMIWINNLIPLLVCVTIVHIYLSGQAAIIIRSLTTLCIIIAITLLASLCLVLYVSIKYRVKISIVINKMLPTYIIGCTTSSSSAAYLTNCNTCRKKYGIDDSLVDFGIPFGQVICMPGCAILLICICVYLASFYNIAITPTWIVTAIIGSVLIAIAAPPIPGGGIAILSTILTLLGIPLEGLAVAVPIEMITEYIATGLNLFAIQVILIKTADKLKKLNVETLRNK